MAFFVIGVLVFLILIVFRKNKSALSVVVTIAFITGATTAVLAWGLVAAAGRQEIHFFFTAIGTTELYYLMAAWYAMDLLCAVIIVRRYLEYRKINRGSK